jgi:ketol-acid reductoisomerase
MQSALAEIQNKEFVRKWIDVEYKEKQLATLNNFMSETHDWQVEQTGRTIRKVAGLEEVDTGEEEKH